MSNVKPKVKKNLKTDFFERYSYFLILAAEKLETSGVKVKLMLTSLSLLSSESNVSDLISISGCKNITLHYTLRSSLLRCIIKKYPVLGLAGWQVGLACFPHYLEIWMDASAIPLFVRPLSLSLHC